MAGYTQDHFLGYCEEEMEVLAGELCDGDDAFAFEGERERRSCSVWEVDGVEGGRRGGPKSAGMADFLSTGDSTCASAGSRGVVVVPSSCRSRIIGRADNTDCRRSRELTGRSAGDCAGFTSGDCTADECIEMEWADMSLPKSASCIISPSRQAVLS